MDTQDPDLKTYKAVHQAIRRDLERRAFDETFKCQDCGKKKNLQIHLPNFIAADSRTHGNWILLCKRCHKRHHR